MMTKKSRYTGDLANPLPADPDRVEGARAWRILELFRHYGISPFDRDAFMRLALALADDHVPGFQFERASSWPDWELVADGPTLRGKALLTAARDFYLCCEMIRLRKAGLSLSAAAKWFVDNRPSMGLRSPGAARVRFLKLTTDESYGARRRMVQLARAGSKKPVAASV